MHAFDTPQAGAGGTYLCSGLRASERTAPTRLSVDEAIALNRVPEAMAQTMIDAAGLFGHCDVHHLSMAGWPATQIVEHEMEARCIAERAATRDVNADMGTLPAPSEAA